MTDSYHFAEPAKATICFDDVKARTIALCKISRPAAVGALAVFSVARARELMPWEWTSYVEYVDGLLATLAQSTVGPFPSGATLTTSGDKIVGRVESMTPTLDKLEASKDPQRAPLPHFNQRTPHDTFGDGFIVTKGAVEAPTIPSPTTDSAYPAIAGLLRG